jgi:predicted nucleic acid-binding protein
VDHVSFLVMRRRGVAVAFAFDPDYASAGFRLLEG